MASIYGPPAHTRRRRPRPIIGESAPSKLSPMQMFWMVIAIIVCIAVMVRLERDAGDPELGDALRRLELIQRTIENYRPPDPALFELPLYQPPVLGPSLFEPLPTPEILEAEPVPAPSAPKSAKKPRRTVPRRAPAQ